MDHLRYRHCGENSPALPNQLSELGARPGPLRFAPYLRLVSPCLPCTEVPSYVKCKVICIQERLLLRLHLPGACFLSTLSPRPLHYQVSPGHASTENIFTHPSIPLASGTSHSYPSALSSLPLHLEISMSHNNHRSYFPPLLQRRVVRNSDTWLPVSRLHALSIPGSPRATASTDLISPIL